MQKQICVSKKAAIVGAFFTCLIIIVLNASVYLSNTKTSYQSKASTPKSKTALLNGNQEIFNFYAIMAQIGTVKSDNKVHTCAGTLIAPGWVLTAAHCVAEYNKLTGKYESVGKNNIHVAAPATARISNFLSFPSPEKVYIHTNYYLYDVIFPKNDIALLRMNSHPKFEKGQDLFTLSLTQPNRNYQDGEIGIILGWGGNTRTLNLGVVPLLSPSRLAKQLAQEKIREMIAGWPNNSVSVVHGDSGGPLIVWDEKMQIYRQIGIISYFSGNYYTTYVNLTHPDYQTWIKNTIKEGGFPLGVEKSFTYKGMGSFVGYVGRKVDSSILDNYYSHICDTAVWGENLPSVCPIDKPTQTPTK